MSKLDDITGKKFNMLTVVKMSDSVNGKRRWECICDCGNKTIVRGNNLKSGAVKSCGCTKKIAHNRMHGESKTKLYRMWKSMIYRCHNPKNHAYKYYGARGIIVCNQWHDYLTFKKWVNETRQDPNSTIERKDNNGNYCPENCKWVDAKAQANNRRNNVIIEYKNETHNLTEWCEILNLDYKNIHNRIYKLGWSFGRAISTPIDTSKRNKAERKINGRIHE